MISIVIRNKNEGIALENILTILTQVYLNEYEEIIVVDNNSTDNSIEIATKFKCKIVTIDNFSYGRATNYGIDAASTNYILLLSSHAIPVGKSFFKNTLEVLQKNEDIAGIRYINSIENYNRAIKNNFVVKEPLKYGLMTGCALVNKEVWLKFKFNEDLCFSEDKEWSQRVANNDFKILDLNETFFYFITRNKKSNLKRYKNENIANYQLNNSKPQKPVRIFLSFLKKIVLTNNLNYLKTIVQDCFVLVTKIEIYKTVK